jgi:hypothetical protein
MRIHAIWFGLTAAVGLLCLPADTTAQAKNVLRGVTTVEVEHTVVPDPGTVKEDFAPTLVEDALRNALRNANITVGEAPVKAHMVLNEFTSGNVAKRLIIGLGAGRSVVDTRLVFTGEGGRELANVKIRVKGNFLFSGYQGGDTQRRQATTSLDQKLAEEIARLK